MKEDAVMRSLRPQGICPERDAARAELLAEYTERVQRDTAANNRMALGWEKGAPIGRTFGYEYHGVDNRWGLYGPIEQ